MSQKKVDAYKAEKANREKIMKKEKLILTIEKLAALVACMVAVCCKEESYARSNSRRHCRFCLRMGQY